MPLLDGSGPDHATRTVGAIRAALARVPFYAKQGLASPDEGGALGEALARLPLLTRDRIRPTLPRAWLPDGRDAKVELASGKLVVIENGVGESRVRLPFDPAWWRAQEARALALHPRARSALAGELGTYRDAVLWVPERGTGSCGSGDPEYEERVEGARLHLNSRQDPTFWSDVVMTRMLDELARHETVGLLADPFYLDVLARHAATVGRRLDVKGFLALTRARTTASHREATARVYAGPTFQLYGAREVGVLFVEGEDGLLHHAPITTHVELLRAKVETPGASEVALVVVTTLDREVCPLVRFVLGDLVQVASADGGATATDAGDGEVPALSSVEGKLEDAIVRPDGAIVTAGAIDRALGPLALAGYQVTQREPGEVEIEVVSGSPDDAKSATSALLAGMRVTARSTTAIAVEPNGKYKTTRRTGVALALHTAFEGVTT